MEVVDKRTNMLFVNEFYESLTRVRSSHNKIQLFGWLMNHALIDDSSLDSSIHVVRCFYVT